MVFQSQDSKLGARNKNRPVRRAYFLNNGTTRPEFLLLFLLILFPLQHQFAVHTTLIRHTFAVYQALFVQYITFKRRHVI